MWEKEKDNRNYLRNVTVFLVLGFVLLQMAVFVRDAFRYPSSTGVMERIVHDTVIIKEKVKVPVSDDHYAKKSVSAGNGSVAAAENAGVARKSSSAQSGDGTQSFGSVSALPKGDYGWKWDVVELNSADSALLDELPGIGGYYAKQILRYRERLGAFTEVWQLLEIRGIDSARVAGIASRVRIDSSLVTWINLNTVTEETLAAHPYVGKLAAKGIIRLRESRPDGKVELDDIVRNGILTGDGGKRLGRYLIEK